MSLGFLGEFQHSLDAKGRVILPVEYREPLGGGAVLTRVLDGCLAVYSEGEFEVLAEKVREFARLERDVMVLGVDNRIELWNPVRWREVEADAQTDIQAGGAGLDDMGFI